MTLTEVVALLTGAEKVLSADGTQSLFKTTAGAVDTHLKNEGYSIDKLRENEASIPEPVRRTDQPDKE